MFVQNLTGETLTYKKGNVAIEVPPLRVKYISDLVVSAKTLKKEFGDKAVVHALELEEKKTETKTAAKATETVNNSKAATTKKTNKKK